MLSVIPELSCIHVRTHNKYLAVITRQSPQCHKISSSLPTILLGKLEWANFIAIASQETHSPRSITSPLVAMMVNKLMVEMAQRSIGY